MDAYDTDSLSDKLNQFMSTAEERSSQAYRLEQVREKFVDDFNLEAISNMEVDDYVIGKANDSYDQSLARIAKSGRETFCYRLEHGELNHLGRYTPGSSKAYKLYVNKDGNYVANPSFASNAEDALQKIRTELTNLIIAGAHEDYDTIRKCSFSHNLIGKILSTYYPATYLHIFSSKMLTECLAALRIECNSNDEFDMRKAISSWFYNDSEVLLALKAYTNDIEPFEGYYLHMLCEFIGAAFPEVSKKGNEEDEYFYANPEMHSDEKLQNLKVSIPSLNLILYGPPGTGKTYNTIERAVSMIDPELKLQDHQMAKKLFDEYRERGQIEFVTFHQSYGYEDFIEGIRPVFDADVHDVSYEIADGVFKRIAARAAGDAGLEELLAKFVSHVKKKLEKTDKYDIGSDSWIEDVKSDKKGNPTSFVVGASSRNVTQNISLDIVRRDFIDFMNGQIKRPGDIKPTRESSKDVYGNSTLAYRIYESIEEFRNETSIELTSFDDETANNYVLIIDEINRGNISKIFGETITLIEDDKRLGEKNALSVTLPYSGKSFGVPANLCILATMNTADRSIALMDTALRRRFDFEELMPDPDLLAKRHIVVDDIDVAEMLRKMNARIEYLYDREHTIGHAYFMGLDKRAADGVSSTEELDNAPSIDDLAVIMQRKIIPLLQEYFFDDYRKIALVLGGCQTRQNGSVRFVKEKDELRGEALFDFDDQLTNDIDMSAIHYEINEGAFKEPAAYKAIYQSDREESDIVSEDGK